MRLWSIWQAHPVVQWRESDWFPQVRRKDIPRQECLDLLKTHIKENIWQIGGKCYRQKEGIPQGSKISSLLCSIFYAALEMEHLSFLTKPGSVGSFTLDQSGLMIDTTCSDSWDISTISCISQMIIVPQNDSYPSCRRGFRNMERLSHQIRPWYRLSIV